MSSGFPGRRSRLIATIPLMAVLAIVSQMEAGYVAAKPQIVPREAAPSNLPPNCHFVCPATDEGDFPVGTGAGEQTDSNGVLFCRSDDASERQAFV